MTAFVAFLLPYEVGATGLKRYAHAHLNVEELAFWTTIRTVAGAKAWAKQRVEQAQPWIAIIDHNNVTLDEMRRAVANRRCSTIQDINEVCEIGATALQRPIDTLQAGDAVVHFAGGRNIYIDRSRGREGIDSDEAKFRAASAKQLQKFSKANLKSFAERC